MRKGLWWGIFRLWNKRSLDLVDSMIGSFFISCVFRCVEDDFQWTFSGVYGPLVRGRRGSFWDELGSI